MKLYLNSVFSNSFCTNKFFQTVKYFGQSKLVTSIHYLSYLSCMPILILWFPYYVHKSIYFRPFVLNKTGLKCTGFCQPSLFDLSCFYECYYIVGKLFISHNLYWCFIRIVLFEHVITVINLLDIAI